LRHEPIWVIGVDGQSMAGIPPHTVNLIQQADILYGTERLLSLFSGNRAQMRRIRVPLIETLTELDAVEGNETVVILASGDPLFYGIGATLLRRYGETRVKVIPAISSIQHAFARAGESWQDARLLSLHGRSIVGFAQRVHGALVASVFTDGVNTVPAIATYLLHFKMTEYELFVAENLGSEQERTGWYALQEAAVGAFSTLSVVILRRRLGVGFPVFHLGMDDDAFAQRKPDRGLITKREIRVLSLSELSLPVNGVLWDIGSCTGSVAIEAILCTPGLQVFAVEKNAEDLANLYENQIRFRADFTVVHARAPEGLKAWPDPDAVFIGGSGGELSELIELCATRLTPGGRIVVNAATIENLYEAYRTMTELGFAVSTTLIQSARSKPILNLTRFEGMNPVYLVTGVFTEKEETNE